MLNQDKILQIETIEKLEVRNEKLQVNLHLYI